jgi:hypothetical protein
VPQYGEYSQPGAPAGGDLQPPAAPPPGYPQQGYPQQGYVQPGYPQPGYAQPGAYGYGVAPAKPPRRIWDLVLTIILLALGFFGMLAGILYGVLFNDPTLLNQLFQQQGYGDFNGTVGAAPAVIIASHVLLFLVAVGLSIVLLLRRKVAFWIPLTAGVIAAVIFWAMLFTIFLSDPDFTTRVP